MSHRGPFLLVNCDIPAKRAPLETPATLQSDSKDEYLLVQLLGSFIQSLVNSESPHDGKLPLFQFETVVQFAIRSVESYEFNNLVFHEVMGVAAEIGPVSHWNLFASRHLTFCW